MICNKVSLIPMLANELTIYCFIFFYVCCCISAINQLNYKVKMKLKLDFKAFVCLPCASSTRGNYLLYITDL